ncbi:hypothetical protein GCM10022225_27340 [Plantactinospora mayteni]|uniref:DUF2909 domain-containing protein n=1 Tax=Plantactinospora mayteni TaxID=566021 RepID=A0ABQ4EII1_9ACTN|nr:hypothetical protein [Plantactinospora mayteni]GIG94536.1 hypothetical protein Pma05_11090 [Plantactinospora mayteni]
MSELSAIVGVLLLVAALARAGASSVTWALFRLRLARLLTAGLALFLILIALAYIASAVDPEYPATP